MIAKLFYFLLGLIILIVLVYLLGPRVKFEDIDASPVKINYSIEEIENIIIESESSNDSIKPGNAAHIQWYDGKAKSKVVFLYLHGFGASHHEGYPVHKNLAKKYGANIVLGRFPHNGVKEKHPLLAITPKKLIDYGKEIINQASQLGDELYIISTSTGATVSAYLASEDSRIKGLIMLSPNFGLANRSFNLLDGPWGEQLLNKNFPSGYRGFEANDEIKKYWIHHYRIEALIALDKLVSETMTKSTYKKIDIPYFVGYYFRDEENKDGIIDIKEIKNFEKLTNTPDSKKKVTAFPNANTHVIACELYNPKWKNIQKEIELYLENQLKIKVINAN